MVAIRLARMGAKKKPFYRVVVTDKRRARDSKTLEIVGHYNPRPQPIEVNLERERIQYWMGVGAQPSVTVQRLIKFFDEHGPNLAEAKESSRRAEAEARPPKAVEKPAPKVEEAVAVAAAEGEAGTEAVAEAAAEASVETAPVAAVEAAPAAVAEAAPVAVAEAAPVAAAEAAAPEAAADGGGEEKKEAAAEPAKEEKAAE